MIGKLQFWTLFVGLLTYVVKYFYPDLPFGETEILAAVLFLLGLIGVVPTVRGIRRGIYGATWTDLFRSMSFLTLVAGLIGFVVRYLAPDFPFSDAVILSVIVFVLTRIGITPELQWAGVYDDSNEE